MKMQDHQLIVPLYENASKNSEYVKWLRENKIEYQRFRTNRQSPGFPSGWKCIGPVIKFNRIEDVTAFKLRWI